MRKNQPTCEKSLDTPLQKEIQDHKVENQLPQGDFREEHKEESEHPHIILIDGGCANQREYIDGSLNYERVPTDGWSQLYDGSIEIRFQNVVASKISHEHKYEEIVVAHEEPSSTSPSPLELQELSPRKREEYEEVSFQETHFLEGSLNMNENNIQ